MAALGVAFLVATVFAAPPALASTPSEGTISATNREVAWTGGPFSASNPSVFGCAGPADPTCDAFDFFVDRPEGAKIQVAIAGAEGDDLDLFVFFPDGTEVGRSTTPTAVESIVFDHRTSNGTGPYHVRVQPFLVAPGATYDGIARTTTHPLNIGRECSEFVPDSGGVQGVTDAGQTINLEVLVLLDGVDQGRAEAVFARAAQSYVPANVALTVVRYRPVSFEGTEGSDLLAQAKELLRFSRPPGIDIVYVFSNKDLTSDGDPGLLGQADCIGGVEWDNHAFAVSEDAAAIENRLFPSRSRGPFVTLVDATARVIAHEIGHLMGAHHHYANCVEGVLDDLDSPFELSPCTLMFNFANFISPHFSVVNLAVVRGHAVQFAAP